MKKNLLFAALAIIALTGCHSNKKVVVNPASTAKSIVILYDNDVHCSIDGYNKIAGLRDAINEADTAYTLVVSSGDYLQGARMGTISQGGYIAEAMKEVGYDAVTLGNHEFDYKLPRMFELLEQINAPVTCVNFTDTEGNRVYAPYIIKPVQDKKIAFVGTTTPTTLDTESYAFTDSIGALYSLQPENVYTLVQNAVDNARKDGADYVIILSHLGEDPNDMNVDSHGLIASTTGIDVVLDGHTHSAIEGQYVANKEGKQVLITQTGSGFKNIGKLVISPNGNFSTTLLPTEDMTYSNPKVQQILDRINADAKIITDEPVGISDIQIKHKNAEGIQVVRTAETGLGDLVTDAYRILTGADVALTNGGGIRTGIEKGPINFGNILDILSFDNYVVEIEATGKQIIETLQANIADLPKQEGQFPQVSGMKYTIHTADHTVSDVQVLNKETGKYEPINPDKLYTIATIDYCAYNGGMRNTLKGTRVVRDTIIPYYRALEKFIKENLNGRVGEEYAQPQGRITILP